MQSKVCHLVILTTDAIAAEKEILDSLSKQVQLYLLSRSICAKRHVSFLDFIMHRLSVLFFGGRALKEKCTLRAWTRQTDTHTDGLL